MNIFKTPKTKAFIATLGVAAGIMLLFTGLVYVAKRWPETSFQVVIISGFTFWMLSIYDNFLQKYKKEDNNGTGTN